MEEALQVGVSSSHGIKKNESLEDLLLSAHPVGFLLLLAATTPLKKSA